MKITANSEAWETFEEDSFLKLIIFDLNLHLGNTVFRLDV